VEEQRNRSSGGKKDKKKLKKMKKMKKMIKKLKKKKHKKMKPEPPSRSLSNAFQSPTGKSPPSQSSGGGTPQGQGNA